LNNARAGKTKKAKAENIKSEDNAQAILGKVLPAYKSDTRQMKDRH
jgi:hypothetical protein